MFLVDRHLVGIMPMTCYLVHLLKRVLYNQWEGVMLGARLIQGSLELPIPTSCPFLHASHHYFHA